ncbi:MAG: cupin domain-containing protein [Pseudomonadota bacterium]|nr:cupin domain-containing protein [Pseudomonadota bacterium]
MSIKSLTLTTAALAAVAALGAAQANAGQCPADKTKVDVRTTGEMAPKDVTDDELAFVKLDKEIEGLDGRRLRLRKLVVQPGGVVPWHDHTDRPALIMTAEGQITEYRSDCSVGVVHTAGEVSTEYRGLKHWWRNEGKTPAVLIAADIKNDN